MSAGIPVTLSDVVEAASRTLAARTHTGMPGEVVTYDPSTNTANVRPVVKDWIFESDGERVYEELPIVPSVPVMWPRFGGKVVRGLLLPGDFVWLNFSEKSLAEWRSTGQLSEPVDSRRHSLGYPFATLGAFPDSKPLNPLDLAEVVAGGMIIGDDGGTNQIRIGGTTPGVKISSAGVEPISPVALSVPTDAGLAAMAAAIVTLTAAVNAMITAYNAHTHTVPITGPAGTTASAPPAASVSAAAAGPGAPATTASLKTRSL